VSKWMENAYKVVLYYGISNSKVKAD
jgi:hypothetical protein